MKKTYYTDQYNINSQKIRQLSHTSHLYTTLRMILFVSMILLFALWYDSGHILYFFGAAIACFIFLLLIHRHSLLQDEQHQANNLQQVLKDYLARFDNSWKSFEDCGQEFQSRNLPQDTDLNILGKNSIFQYCCCARTESGRQLLANRLRPEPVSAAELSKRQSTVEYFTKNKALSLHLLTLSRNIPYCHSMKTLLDYIGHTSGLANRFSRIMLYFTPFSTIISIFLSVFGVISFSIPALLIIIQLAFTLSNSAKTGHLLEPVFQLDKSISCYHSPMSLLAANLENKSIGKIDGATIKKSLTPIKHLGIIASLTELRNNSITFFLLNGLFMWDILICELFSHWEKTNGLQLAKWIDQWSETEAALSLAIPGQTKELITMPQLAEDSFPHIEAQNLFHPLISESKAVSNDINLSPSLNIITGSNMSGKTTLLRTLASSCILAYAGSHVCAKTFVLSPLYIMSSIRVNDDIGNGISSFYAELLRIKSIIDNSRESKPMLAVIDEIFKGTNSADRIIGAKKTLRQLTALHLITLVSTHDFELCNIKPENKVPVNNYHFQEYYENDTINFDYIMRPGPCLTTNAIYLLKLAGIE